MSVFAIPHPGHGALLREDIILASPGGAALLLANACAWLAAGLIACFVPPQAAAMAYSRYRCRPCCWRWRYALACGFRACRAPARWPC